MPELRRPTAQREIQRSRMGSGIYLARVINNLDPSYMGSLEVSIFRDSANSKEENTQHFIVRYASPFFGHTPYEYTGLNSGEKNTQEGFNDTQKSYGFWAVPPDIGVTVLIAFVDGDPSQGYWFACVPPRFANHMVPAIAASQDVYLDQKDIKKYGKSKSLPVAEINKRLNAKTDVATDVSRIKRPVHPIADRFLEQGLLDDDVRGITDSGARRDAPSSVMGLSSPGPLDRRAGHKKTKLGDSDQQTNPVIPTGRLGGTQIVLDDGDDRYRRVTPAAEGPVQYVDVVNGTDTATGAKISKEGDPTIPYGECLRLRTRTGHQILLHNSEDLIYIGNARGTTWIEMTSNGKIDVYAQDSVSIHTETDINVRADRDINLEAGRNINMKAVGGRIRQECATDWEILAGNDGKITVANNYDNFVGNDTKITTGNNLDLRTGSANKFTAGSTTDIKSGAEITQSGSRIDLNSFPAKTAAQCNPLEQLSVHPNVKTSASAGWEKKYIDGTLNSIMKRVPMHEPWLQHENQAPAFQTPQQTDRET